MKAILGATGGAWPSPAVGPVWVFVFWICSCGWAAGQQFLYLSDQRIVTVEFTGPERALLNYINLTDQIQIIQAPMLVAVDENGETFRGHVISVEAADDPLLRYQVSQVLGARKFEGFAIQGRFAFVSPPAQVYYRISGLILELETIDDREFALLESRIGELDLEAGNMAQALRRIGFERGFGRLFRAGTPEAAHLEDNFPSLELLDPVLLVAPQPRVPPSLQRELPEPIVVRLAARVSRAGGILELSVDQGLDPVLDNLALQTVRNSWRFLPAIARGEVAEATMKLNVVFQR